MSISFAIVYLFCSIAFGFSESVDSDERSLLLVPATGTSDVLADQVEFEIK